MFKAASSFLKMADNVGGSPSGDAQLVKEGEKGSSGNITSAQYHYVMCIKLSIMCSDVTIGLSHITS